jgi:hypothetical protein
MAAAWRQLLPQATPSCEEAAQNPASALLLVVTNAFSQE